jgi:DNA-binding beta-propeller fold protein YncE
MTDFGWIDAPNAVNLAGIAFDNENGKLYVANRNDLSILVYSWNPTNKTLSLDRELLITDQSGQNELGCFPFPPYGCVTACGLALDEEENLLYVTFINNHYAVTNAVYCYSTDDWTFQKRIEIEVNDVDRYATAVAVYNNGSSKYLFAGAFWGNTYLVRTDLTDTNDPNSYIEKDIDTNAIGAGATGIAVDQQTGFVYVTASDNTIKVFDGLNFPSDPCYVYENDPNINGPAGICVDNGICHLVDVAPNPPDGIVNFLDFAVLANAWLTQSGGAGYNEICDLVDDNSID